MFDNYNNTNLKTSFTPNPYAPQFPPLNQPSQIQQNNPNKPFEVKDVRGNLTGYFWYYGNSVDLVWDIEGEVISADSNEYVDVAGMIKYQTITATIYNWKKEVIDSIKLLPNIDENNNVTVRLPIQGELTQKMVKGTYTIDLVASNAQGYNETLFDTGVCNFEVR